jgi:hypothetical protein
MIPVSRTLFNRVLPGLALAFAMALPSVAQETIVSAQSGPWSAPSTWDGGSVPTAADNVVVASGHEVTLDVNDAAANDLQVAGDLYYSATIPGHLTVHGNVTVGSGGRLRPVDNALEGSALGHTLTIYGNVDNTVGGVFNMRTGSNSGPSVTASAVDISFVGSDNSAIALGPYGTSNRVNSVYVEKTGGARVILGSDVGTTNNNTTLPARLHLNSGILEAGEHTLFVLTSAAAGVEGGSETSYVIGGLGRAFRTSAGTQTIVFPVGDEHGYRPITVNSTVGHASGQYLEVRVVPEDADTGSSSTDGLERLSAVRYYQATWRAGSNPFTFGWFGPSYGYGDGVEAGNLDLRVATALNDRSTWVNQGPETHTTSLTSPPTVIASDNLDGFTVAVNQTFFVALGTTDAASNPLGEYAATLSGRAGWRMLASPVAGATFGALLEPVWTQGFTGADSPDGSSNVMRYSESGRAFASIGSANETIEAGEGFIAYIFEKDDGQSGVGSFPKHLGAKGPEHVSVSTDLSYTATGLQNQRGWNMLGNPFASSASFNLEASGADVEYALHVWDPNAGPQGEYISLAADNASAAVVAPFQGFWVKANSAGQSVAIGQDDRTTGGSFYGKQEPLTARLALSLRHGDYAHEAIVRFRDDAAVAKDRFDVSLPRAFVSEYMRLFTRVEGAGQFVFNSLPLDLQEVVEIPVGVATTLGGTFTLAWGALEELPYSWRFEITDHSTGETRDLRDAGSITFDADASPDGTERFLLSIDPAGFVSTLPESELPQQIALHQNHPNPFNPSTTIRFDLPKMSPVHVAVFDVTGRQVAVLATGTMPAGEHQLNWDASGMASGLYIYRLEAAGRVLHRTMTLVK